MKIIYESFGEKLKFLRKKNNIGQLALAKKIGVGKSIISMWENGICEPTLSRFVAVAKYFGVTTDYLAGLTE